MKTDVAKKAYICRKTYPMKKFFLISILFSAMCVTAPAQALWADFARYEKSNAEVTTRPKAVFMGDSITDGWFAQDPEFFTTNNFLGRGISGQVTGQMLVRFRRDVIAHKPEFVVFLGGLNDIARNDGEIALEDTFGNIVSMMEIAKANKIKPVLCLLFPTTNISWTPEVTDPLAQITRLNSMLSSYAKEHRIKVVEYFSDIDKSSGNLPRELSHDSIHPNLDGYRIMEREILKYIGK